LTVIAHLADVHLSFAQFNLLEREEDIYELFSDAMRMCLEERVKAVLIAGDLFDKYRPSNRALSVFRKAVQPLISRGIKIIAVQGDHDAVKRRDLSVLHVMAEYLEGFKLLPAYRAGDEKTCYTIRDGNIYIKVYGAPFIPRILGRVEYYNKLFRIIERHAKKDAEHRNVKNILLGHFPIVEFFPEKYDPGVSLSTLPRNIDYFALGHLHNRIIDRTPWGSVVAYSGSLDILRKDEIRDWQRNGKGFYLVDLSGDEPSIEKVNLDVRPQFVIEGPPQTVITSLGKILNRESLKKPILHITLHTKEKHRDLIERRVANMLEGRVLTYRLTTITESEKEIVQVKKSCSEIEIIASKLGGDKNLALAVMKLKDCIADCSPKECNSEVEEVLSFKNKWKQLLADQLSYEATTITNRMVFEKTAPSTTFTKKRRANKPLTLRDFLEGP